MAEGASDQGRIFAGRGLRDDPDTPPPPWQIGVEDYFVIGVRFDRNAVRAVLPPALEPLDDCSGIVAAYRTVSGAGFAPNTTFYVCITVKNHDSADGSPGFWILSHVNEERAYRTLEQDNPSYLTLGRAEFTEEGARISARCEVGGQDIGCITVNRTGEFAPVTTSTHNYLEEGAIHPLRWFTVVGTARYARADPVECLLRQHVGSPFRGLLPIGLDWALYAERMNLVIGAVVPVEEPTTSENQLALIELISRIPVGLIIVGEDRGPIFVNPTARDMLTTRQTSDEWRLTEAHVRTLTDAAIGSGSLVQQLASRPIAIERGPGRLPLIAEGLPMPEQLAVERAVLIVLRDPETETAVAEPRVLELLGLTPAEARLAVAAAGSDNLRAAAASLGITENTAHSTLKVVYAKLGITARAQLAQIVARLS